jgi:hypothetical protein
MLDRIRTVNYITPMKKLKRPKDTNQLAKSIVDLATGEATEPVLETGKNPAAVLLGRLGGLKGGKARAEALTKAQRVKIARNAAKTRWGKNKGNNKT